MSSPKTTPHWKQYNRLPTKKYHDPWARREAWRHHEMFSPRYQLMRLIPGFTWGVAAFIVYLGVEKV
ncbi:6432_t:CDS:2 [Ambispora gerdemannii]|uniref:6432_t:CDS:1 n=1 Tax=Ambispora gerdemannii TaxID=144530 RepID=A0A9N9B1N3_9GLOM|nr:6432_t:CDS:2 [Ambispora gerdemannii]